MAGSLPTFVLVHGAFHGGWCWRPVARILRKQGYEVFTPTQTGLGDRRHLLSGEITIETFVLDVLNLLLFEELEDVVLVGHSFGARTISGVADRVRDRIRHLVFIDGGMQLDQRSRLEAMQPEARDARIASAAALDGLAVPPPPAERFGVSDTVIAQWLERHLTPQPIGAERTAIQFHNPLGNGLPATYLRCTQPLFDSTESSAAYARSRTEWTYSEIAAGHNAIVTHPQEIADFLMECASSAP